MPSNRVFAFWGLCLMVIPLAAARLGGGGGRVDRVFTGSCVPVAFLLLYFVPRMAIDPAVAAAATVGFSGAAAFAYRAFSHLARRTTGGLLAVLAAVDVAALAAIHISAVKGFGNLAFSLLLVGVTAATAWGALEAMRRIGGRAGSARGDG